MINALRSLSAGFLLVILASCGGSGGGGGIGGVGNVAACSTVGQNRFVYEVMQDIYFWVEFLPTVDPDGFESPEALLEAIRYQVLDSSLSDIRDEEANDAFFGQGQFIGVGLTNRVIGNRIFVGQVIIDSPADQAGFLRGFELLSINGQAAADVIAGGSVSAAFGPDVVGQPVDLTYRDKQGNEFSTTLNKALATIQSVPFSTVFDVNGVQVGYLKFRNFIEPSFDALDSAFADFNAQGVTEVILDVRYNGGGLVSVAEHLGGLIGGSGTAGQVFSNWVHNANNVDRNRTSFYPNPAQSIGLSRLVVITTRSSASASELVVNALRPYMQVVLIGDRSFGKPVGSYGFPFCGKVLNPMSFNLRNADDQGDYFDGLPVDCAAEDDLANPFGDPAEASTGEALFYIENGRCSGTAQRRVESGKKFEAWPAAEDGWRLTVGAH